MEKKVFIVTSGDCSDYCIRQVFSTREKAEEYVDANGSDYSIGEYVLDLEVERKTACWTVGFEYNSGKWLYSYIVSGHDALKDCFSINPYASDQLLIIVEADGMKKANKIALERFIQIKALESIKFPYLRNRCVMNRVFDSWRFEVPPIYHYPDGEIVLDDCKKLKDGIECKTIDRKEIIEDKYIKL